VKYTKERKQFGKAIAEFQGVQFQIARAATEVEAARLLVYNAARLRDLGHPFLTEAAMCKILRIGGRRARRVTRRQFVRRQWIREGISGREALPRRKDRADLRGHLEPAATNDCKTIVGLRVPGFQQRLGNHHPLHLRRPPDKSQRPARRGTAARIVDPRR
jgi:hypothetical protein